ncbi:predicted protein [Plenodomus lingam JN3]|uniref:Predicted protein n=1 Tax=Leptosphaeria maculans (strain JN3 / isolate v23.1.3 / race Av1-4-5-6-7-8) TaxID=985895 RepID=E4ZS63_LEPMJ|nr:predicted protein [Plenodomus lingam JN3]CBX94243.1 predicted protein [Plenodomus lingam JN3]
MKRVESKHTFVLYKALCWNCCFVFGSTCLPKVRGSARSGCITPNSISPGLGFPENSILETTLPAYSPKRGIAAELTFRMKVSFYYVE